MTRLAWNDTLALGIPEIDDQHKRLVALINDVFEAMGAGMGETAARAAFWQLRDYTRDHFKAEERMMRDAGYPELEAHHQEHERLTTAVGDSVLDLLGGSYSESQTRVFLKTWLVDHILGWDFKLVEYLRKPAKDDPATKLPQGADFYGKVLENMYDGVYFVDRQRVVTYWNKGAERITGYSAQELLGKSCADNVLRHVDEEGNQLCLQGCPLSAAMRDGVGCEAQVFLHHKEGHRVPVFVRGTPLTDDNGAIVGAVEVFSPNDKLVQSMEIIKQLRNETLHDTLTGLGNRKYADINLENHLSELSRRNVPFGLLFIDVDHFKRVNDTWGHNTGDDVLRMVARTIANGLRPLDVACRWGGEEFVAVLPNTDLEGLHTVAERLRMLVEHSWLEHETGLIKVTASVGGALSQQGDTAETLVARADEEVYWCKETGRNKTSISGMRMQA